MGVESWMGIGTTFTFSFPAKKAKFVPWKKKKKEKTPEEIMARLK